MDVADKLNKAVRYFRDDGYRFRVNAAHGVYRNMPDEEYIRRMFRAKMGAEPDLESPRTFNEKMQWLKLHDRKPIYTVMVDKYAAKQFAADIIGQEHIIPNLGVWDRAEDVDFDALPEQFVIKCTHDSHGLVICRDKSALDESAAREKLAQGLKRDYYLALREWPYKNVPHRIIAEPYLEDTDKPGELTDYKIHCFNAEPRIIQVITDRFSPGGMINDHYSLDWEKLKLGRGKHPMSDRPIPRPAEMDEMLSLARRLCAGTSYLRTDFYIVDHKIYFGELTFFPASGFTPFVPEEWDRIWGDWIDLPTADD